MKSRASLCPDEDKDEINKQDDQLTGIFRAGPEKWRLAWKPRIIFQSQTLNKQTNNKKKTNTTICF